MKKTIYLITITLVTVVCIIVGTLVHVGGFFELGFIDGMSGETVHVNYSDRENFSKIDMDLKVVDLELSCGDELIMSYDGVEKLQPEIEVEDGVLKVVQKAKGNTWGNSKCNLHIQLPTDMVCEELKIQANVGDLNIHDFDTDLLTIDANVGDIDVSESNTGDISITSDIGDIQIENCRFGNMDISSDIGDVEILISQDISDYSVFCTKDLGSIQWNGESHKEISKVGDGEYHINLSTDTGEIEVREH